MDGIRKYIYGILALAAILLLSSPCQAQSQQNWQGDSFTYIPKTFINLGPVINGRTQFCSNCQANSNPCVAGGTGAWITGVNNQWICSVGGVSNPVNFGPISSINGEYYTTGFGVKGDVREAKNCTFTAATPGVITCATPFFVPTDNGKIAVLEGHLAPTNTGPSATNNTVWDTLVYVNATSAHLTSAAVVNTIGPDGVIFVGTDDTTSMNGAYTAAAPVTGATNGNILHVQPGLILVKHLYMLGQWTTVQGVGAAGSEFLVYGDVSDGGTCTGTAGGQVQLSGVHQNLVGVTLLGANSAADCILNTNANPTFNWSQGTVQNVEIRAADGLPVLPTDPLCHFIGRIQEATFLNDVWGNGQTNTAQGISNGCRQLINQAGFSNPQVFINPTFNAASENLVNGVYNESNNLINISSYTTMISPTFEEEINSIAVTSGPSATNIIGGIDSDTPPVASVWMPSKSYNLGDSVIPQGVNTTVTTFSHTNNALVASVTGFNLGDTIIIQGKAAAGADLVTVITDIGGNECTGSGAPLCLAWTAAAASTTGTPIIAEPGYANHIYRYTGAVTSGATQPTWCTTLNCVLVDNGVNLVEYGSGARFHNSATASPFNISGFRGGAPTTIGVLVDSGTNGGSTSINGSFFGGRYGVFVTNSTNGVTIQGTQFSPPNYASLYIGAGSTNVDYLNNITGAGSNCQIWDNATTLLTNILTPTLKPCGSGQANDFIVNSSGTPFFQVPLPITFNSFLFSQLASKLSNNGMIGYCADCTIASPCAGSGTGAMAKRLNGIAVCN